MPTGLLLVIDHRETQVRMDGRALRIERPERPTEHIPLGVIGLVVIHGSPLVGCEVWRELAERNIPAIIQPARGQGQSALIGATLGNTIALRLTQHRAAADPPRALDLARRLVAAKITGQRQVRARLSGAADPLPDFAAAERQVYDSLAGAQTSNNLMGAEGIAAAAWYGWLGGWLPAHWRFAGRNRRPPRDPVNALLSLGYTILAGEVLRAVQEQGLDPALGYLHGIVPGRESLVLDLMEPLRPSVDLVICGLLDNCFQPSQFTTSARDGCRLNKTGRARFYQEWAIARADWPDLEAAAPWHRPPADTGTDSSPLVPVTSLPALCRRQVERLRAWLQPTAGATIPPADDLPF
jgi:CRISPR-associated protein Cas1